MIQNIPFELQQLRQWVVASGAPLPNGDVDKVPRNPRTGEKADVTDPDTWGTFAEAQASSYKLIGFVLSPEDPYTIIDLDDPRKNKDKGWEENVELVNERKARHAKILDAFESYAEYSQSGNGIHIIVRGRIPKGCRKDKVEVYSDGRYMVCTGNPYNTFPITDQQPLLDVLFAEMQSDSSGEVDLVQVNSNIPDEDICRMAYNASNGAKFWQLWQGNWKGDPLYPSQSEADFALLAIIAFYTKDNEQVRRIFRGSALGQRDKAQRNDKYINFALRKIRAHELPPVDMSELLQRAANIQKQHENKTPTTQQVNAATGPTGPTEREDQHSPEPAIGERTVEHGEDKANRQTDQKAFSYPPGFVGDLARHFHDSAIRPVPQIALAGAIALTAGVVARSYNISNTGLNQYIILIANTGTGKEGIGTAVEAMIAAARMQVPAANEFVGPSIFASGQALVRVLDKQPCFVSVLGEFGLTLQTICDNKANTASLMLKRILLDLYSKSGFHNVLRPSVYSDTEKNTQMVQAPCLTIIGESTPSTFYDKLDISHIAEGLVPRFCVVEYTGPRPPTNEQAGKPPPEELVNKFSELVAIALTTKQNRTFCPITISPEAKAMLKKFDQFCDNKINSASFEVDRHVWNRAHLKALKLAGVIAVGCNTHAPVVTEEIARWALEFTWAEVGNMAKRFAAGEFGTGGNRQNSDLRRVLEDYVRMDYAQRLSYGVKEPLIQTDFIPATYIRRRALRLSSFNDDRRGPDAALESLLRTLVQNDIITQVPAPEAFSMYKVRTPVYALGSGWDQGTH